MKKILHGAPAGPVVTFKAKVWQYPGDEAWHFVSLPKPLSDELHVLFADVKRGWGSLKVSVMIGQTRWQTSVFPESKTKVYMLPLKAEVRKREQIVAGDTVEIILEVVL
jgi:hypothetical protein